MFGGSEDCTRESKVWNGDAFVLGLGEDVWDSFLFPSPCEGISFAVLSDS